ncbi:hypothetical protein ACWEU6_12985 [Streptosporangium sandarakinum]
MELGNDNLGFCGSQSFRYHGEVLGTVIQTVNEHHGSQFARLLKSASGR